MNLSEDIRLAMRSIAGNKLRTVLTMLIIAFGIMALVGIITAISAIQGSINQSFSAMGANSFSFRNKEVGVKIGKRGKKAKVFRDIKFDEALKFKQNFQFHADVCLSARINSTAQVTNGNLKTNPNVTVIGMDENYLKVSGYEILHGRFPSKNEIDEGENVCVLASDVVAKIFINSESAIGRVVSIGVKKYRVIGLLKSKGVSKFLSSDNIVFIGLINARRNWEGASNKSIVITTMVQDPGLLHPAIAEAEGMLRVIRQTPLTEENDFETQKSDDIAQELIGNLKYVSMAATIIGFITLLGAAIGLMNIMLVSVNERTREIGVSKAIGATKSTILQQFLIESMVICQLGGICGILLGIAAGNAVAILVGAPFVIPWIWVIGGIVICMVVGISAGIYPARVASKLNPINALRHE